MNHLTTVIIYLIIEPEYFAYLHLNLRFLKVKDYSLRYFQIIINQQFNYVDFIHLEFNSIPIILYHQSSIQQLFQYFLLEPFILNLKRHFNAHLITLDLNYSNPKKYFL